jgi:eukaryotic-like serine/threonine-protein kinase
VSSLTGQTIDGYRVGALLGAGGMGEVYQAFKADNTQVAIKVLRADHARNPMFQGRFAREISIMEALKHPHIMPILGQGIHNQELYYTMRLIQGSTLTTAMRREKFTPLTWEVVLSQICEALNFGHQQNLIHRDVKPDNIFIERNGDAYHIFIGDFGLGKRVGVDKTLTDENALLGTPAYLSPECAMGETLDKRSDLYSLAVVTYEVLVGQLPFREPMAHLTAMAHVTQKVPPPDTINPAFPPALQAMILHGLEKDQLDRIQTAQQFIEEYRNALNQLTEAERNTVYAV